MRGVFRLVALPVVMAAATSGCVAHTAAVFQGRARAALVAPGQIQEENALPLGYDSLGSVEAHCTLTDGQHRLQSVWLSDVDCSEPRLVSVLRERAAEVGGELLVARACYSQVLGNGPRRTLIECHAYVARPDNASLERRPLQRAHTANVASATEAWRIRVDFTPAPHMPKRSPRRGDLVHEVGALPAGQVRVGDISAHCRRNCSREAVHDGVRIAAGRMGATDVAGVHCIHRGQGWACTGVATTYEVPPTLSPASW